MSAKLTGVLVLGLQGLVADNACSFICIIVSRRSFQGVNLIRQFELQTFLSKDHFIVVAHQISLDFYLVAVLLICDREKLAASV